MSGFVELFGRDGGVFLFLIIAVIGGTATGITKIVLAHYRQSQRDEMDTQLKLEMIQRGMSVEEIKDVLLARSVESEVASKA